jgi:hypothetical protein
MPDSTCWPGDDLDGFTEVDPPKGILAAYWNAEILDTTGVTSDKILPVDEPFTVRFRLELRGPVWKCTAGDWKFDMGFDQHGGPLDFKLSDKLPAGTLTVADWKGCDTICVEKEYEVPAGTIDEAVYEITAMFQLYCCDKPAAVVGFDSLEEYQWYIA